MNLLRFYPTNRKYLLPLVIMAAVIFIIQGISVSNFSNPQEPKLSTPQKDKPSTSAVVKILLKSPQSKIAKTTNFLDLFSNVHQIKKPAVLISASRLESHSFISAAISTIPARAPPA